MHRPALGIITAFLGLTYTTAPLPAADPVYAAVSCSGRVADAALEEKNPSSGLIRKQ